MRAGARCTGPATATGCGWAAEVAAPADVALDSVVAVAGSPDHAAQFGLPVVGPEFPAPSALVAAVSNWDGEPEPLVPLYLRRPDAKTLAERGLR